METDVREMVLRYSDMLYRMSMVYLCNEHDAQDVIQDTFCKYLEKKPDFQSEEHQKAWLLRVASNRCKDILRARARHPSIDIGKVEENLAATEREDETLAELLELPVKYKTALFLFYAEGYQIKEIAGILGISEGAVKMRLMRGREKLRRAGLEENRWESDTERKRTIKN